MKKKKKKRAQLPFRLNVLFFIVFLMFSVLIVQLGVVQILNGQTYQDEIEQTIQDTTVIPVPRGKIYDRNQNTLVDNEALYAITYTPPKGVQAKEKLELAEKLTEFIAMDNEKAIKGLTERNKKEYWYLKNEEEANERLTKEERAKINDNAKEYNEVLARITDEEIEDLSKEQLEVIVIKKELDKGYSLTPQVIKNKDVTAKEYAQVAEHLDVLPGINATTDWNRSYSYDALFSSFLGKVTSQSQGIPADQEDYYLTRGYSRNDRVGKGGLEEQYEDLLRGRKEQIQYTTNKNHQVIDSKTIVEGERGKDLILTVDVEFQQKIDEILRDQLRKTINKFPHDNRLLTDALAVVLNPKTGEILALSGQEYDHKEKEFSDAAYKTVNDAHVPGSSIKGATVLAGYQSGVIQPYQTFVDRPMKIGGEGGLKKSVYPMGVVNDLDALERSSNVYMFNIALRMGGEYNYKYGEKVSFNTEAFQEMRNYFHQLGLGVETGIDLPSESTGYRGSELKAGLLMDYGIGQYDTFTTLQMAQYVSTIANDGYRTRPHLLKEVRLPTPLEGELGPVYRRYNTEVLNRIDMDISLINRVQEGFRRSYNGSRGTARSEFQNKSYVAAGKTGTAESYCMDPATKNVVKSENRTLVGYAPFDDPEIAYAIIVPCMGRNSKNQNPINLKIGSEILDTYFELKKEREGEL